MVRTGALVLLLITGVLAGAGPAAAAAPSLTVTPETGLPRSQVVALPTLDQPGPCEVDLDHRILATSPGKCGPNPSRVFFAAPAMPGAHPVTACTPTCAEPAEEP